MTTLEALHLRKNYEIRGTGLRNKTLRAVDDVSIVVRPGESVALVGESGSGKSTIAKMLIRLVEPTGGDITLDGAPIGRGRRATKAYRSRVQMVFQDPFSSLNPSLPIRHQLARPLRIHGIVKNRAEEERELRRLLDSVNLGPADEMLAKYPHELSGGQRQRIAIARALAPRPEVLIADEPVSMLDVSIRLEILQLLDDLKRQRNLAVLYITHDLATARHFSSQIVVMRNGRVVERGGSSEVILNPVHPYTQLLVRAAPDPKSEPFVVDPDRYLASPDVAISEADPGPTADGSHWARAWSDDPAVATLLASLTPATA
ncbi:ABC transporter ATP-binding protein [Leifsonia poae]|uniref:ABC transporter ATP-binding protein n=1 Tax=Leifsonia poae TaxID=110933 RepID=UPI001CBD35DD|nr:ATP-binding cassette domain-containing protein [Leifsonia poae]